MRARLFVALAMVLNLSGMAAHAASVSERRVCDVVADVIDPDPAGANVRASPGGPVIARLRLDEDGWIEAHLIGQVGDWYEIDRAVVRPASAPARTLDFHGGAYLHRTLLGVGGLVSGVPLYLDHDDRSRPLDTRGIGDQPIDLLGCWGGYLELRTAIGVGWTKRVCTNMLTTCV